MNFSVRNIAIVYGLLVGILGISGEDNNPFLGRSTQTIVTNIGSFSKLYVTYHKCAWSPYYDYDNADNNNNDCNVAIDDNNNNNDNGQLWYVGLTPCFRANVAYSLYGVLKGKEGDNSTDGCLKSTYINTFVTTGGVESFIDSIEATGLVTFSDDANGNAINSECQKGEANNNNNNNNNEDNNNNDAESSQHNTKMYGTYQSYGLACSDLKSKSASFVYNTFQGSYCDARSIVATTNTMETLNDEIGAVQCLEIYNAANNADNADNNNNGITDELDFLQQSDYCDVREYNYVCPDPYGFLGAASRKQSSSIARSMNPRRQRVKDVFSWIMLVLGILFLAASGYSLYAKKHNQEIKQRSLLFSRSDERRQREEKERQRKQKLIEEMQATRAKAKEEQAAAKAAAKAKKAAEKEQKREQKKSAATAAEKEPNTNTTNKSGGVSGLKEKILGRFRSKK